MSLKSELYKLRCDVLKPAPRLTLPEWADTYRHLSRESSSEAGRWRTSRVEVARGPMLAVTDPSVEKITVMAPTQLKKTELINNIVGYFIHQDPSPIIVVQPTKEMGEAWSKDRLEPMLRDSPVLSKVLANKHAEGGNKILHKQFDGGQISVVGSNAPGGLAMRPIRVVLCDEIDKYPESSGKEGDPIKLVSERSATFWNRLIVLVCSPTLDQRSRIHQSYMESDQRKYYLKCPHCKHEQVPEWEQVKYEDPNDAQIFCVECEKPWTEAQRLKAIQAGYWKAHAEFRGHAGFHCSKLVSPWEPIKKLAQKFEDAKDKPEQMKTFVNTQLARTYKEDTDVPDWRRLYERREGYPRNVIPKEAAFLVMGVDVQGDRLECEIKAFGPVKNSWSIDYRIIYGKPYEQDTWNKLERIMNEDFEIEGAKHKRSIEMTAVDSGYSTQDVYYFCKKFRRDKIMVTKGYDHLDAVIGLPKPVDINRRGKKHSRGTVVWPMGSSHIKAELYGFLKKDAPLEGDPDPYGFCHYPEYGEEFFKMLTAEEIATKIVNGYMKRQWIKVRNRNESLDTSCLCRAAASALGLDIKKRDALVARALKINQNKVKETNEPIQKPIEKPIIKKKLKITRRESNWL